MTETTEQNLIQDIVTESGTLRVHCDNADAVNYDKLTETKPDFIHWVGKSNDADQNKTSFLIGVDGSFFTYACAEENRGVLRVWLKNNM